MLDVEVEMIDRALCCFNFKQTMLTLHVFAFVQGEGDKVVEERRLQFNDETTTTTSAVWQSKSEVKGEEGTNSTTSQDVTEEEKKERPQSDVLLPLLTPNKEIGVLLKEESANTAISASQAPQAYHPLNPPTSSPFNRQDFFLGLLLELG